MGMLTERRAAAGPARDSRPLRIHPGAFAQLRLRLLGLLLALLALASCSARQDGLERHDVAPASEIGKSTAPLSAPSAGLPGLPAGIAGGSLPRGASTYNFSAVDLAQAGPGATFVGDTLSLDGSAGPAWAVIGANCPPDATPPGGIIMVGSATNLWVGCANYGSMRWEMNSAPYQISSVKNMALPTATMYNAEHSFYLVFSVPKGGSASLQISCDMTLAVPADPTWNLLVWIAGDNNLAAEGVGDLNELEAVGSNENVRIFAGYDIDPAWLGAPVEGIDQVHFIKVVQDSNEQAINTGGDPLNMSFPRAGYNSADPAHVVEFVDWVANNFPAENTALVLWNHGSGWRLGDQGQAFGRRKGPRGRRLLSSPRDSFAGLTRSVSGVLGDDTEGGWNLTGNQNIVAALGDRHFEMLLLDACNMGQVEAVYDYRNLADYVVASQCLVPGPGYPYTDALNTWNAGFPLAPDAIGAAFVDAVQAHYSETGDYVTHGVFKSSDVTALAGSLGALAAGVIPKAETEKDLITTAMANAYEPDFGDGTRDVQAFLSAYAGATQDPALQALAGDALLKLQGAVLHFQQFNQDGSNGLGLFLPSTTYYDPFYTDEYAQTEFNQDTNWLDLFAATGVPGDGGGGGFSGEFVVDADWAPGDILSIDWAGDADTDIDLLLREPSSQPWQLVGPVDGSGGTLNLLFSEDSWITELPTEYIQLRDNGAESGTYEAYLQWFDFVGNPSIDVHVELLNPDFSPKQDLGYCSINEAFSYWRYAKLTLQ